jgi:hypothetical protein
VGGKKEKRTISGAFQYGGSKRKVGSSWEVSRSERTVHPPQYELSSIGPPTYYSGVTEYSDGSQVEAHIFIVLSPAEMKSRQWRELTVKVPDPL